MKRSLKKVIIIALILCTVFVLFSINSYAGYNIIDGIKVFDGVNQMALAKVWDECIPVTGAVSRSELQHCIDLLNSKASTIWATMAQIPPNSISYSMTWLSDLHMYRIVYDLTPAFITAWKILFGVEYDSWGYVYRSDGTFPYAWDETVTDVGTNTAPDSADEVDRDYYIGVDQGDTIINADNSTTTTVTTGDIYSGNLVDYSTSTFYDGKENSE